MAPCARLYGYLGCQLMRSRPHAAHPYVRWAHTYSSAGYLGMVGDKEALLNRIGRRAPYGARPACAAYYVGPLKEPLKTNRGLQSCWGTAVQGQEPVTCSQTCMYKKLSQLLFQSRGGDDLINMLCNQHHRAGSPFWTGASIAVLTAGAVPGCALASHSTLNRLQRGSKPCSNPKSSPDETHSLLKSWLALQASCGSCTARACAWKPPSSVASRACRSRRPSDSWSSTLTTPAPPPTRRASSSTPPSRLRSSGRAVRRHTSAL